MLEPIGLALIVIISFVLLPPLLDGVERKIKAMIHSRIGPPILQTWYDLLKLFEKDIIAPYNSLHLLVLVILLFVLEMLFIVFFVVFLFVKSIMYDVYVIIGLFTIIQVLLIAIPLVTTNPFAIIGASREVMLTIVNEVAFIILLGLYCFFTGTTSFSSLGKTGVSLPVIIVVIALFVSSYVGSGRIPFDIAEAEPELASGVMIELSGPVLAIYLYSVYLRRFIVKLLPAVFLTPLIAGFSKPVLFILYIVAVSVLWVAYSVLAATLARSRVDLAPVTLLKIYLVLIAVAVLAYYVGV